LDLWVNGGKDNMCMGKGGDGTGLTGEMRERKCRRKEECDSRTEPVAATTTAVQEGKFVQRKITPTKTGKGFGRGAGA